MKSYKENRRCRMCGKKLSIYNTSKICFYHHKKIKSELIKRNLQLFIDSTFETKEHDGYSKAEDCLLRYEHLSTSKSINIINKDYNGEEEDYGEEWT